MYGDARFWSFGVPGEPEVRWGDSKFARFYALCLVTPERSVTLARTSAKYRRNVHFTESRRLPDFTPSLPPGSRRENARRGFGCCRLYVCEYSRNVHFAESRRLPDFTPSLPPGRAKRGSGLGGGGEGVEMKPRRQPMLPKATYHCASAHHNSSFAQRAIIIVAWRVF